MSEAQMFWNGSAQQQAVQSQLAAQQTIPSKADSVISPPSDIYRDSMANARVNALDNSYLSQQFAERQMSFQALSQLAAQEFNSREAAKNRDWQEYMSNTAHQREVRDLLAAGLNPILSAMGGNGATTGSGATASSQAMSGASGSVDTSANNTVASMVAAAINAENQYEMNKVNAITNLAIAEQQRKNNLDITKMQIDSSKYLGELAAATSRYGTDSSSETSRAIAEMSAAASMYGAAQTAGAMVRSAGINAASAQSVANTYTQSQQYIAEHYPNNPTAAIAAISKQLGVQPADILRVFNVPAFTVVDELLGALGYKR